MKRFAVITVLSNTLVPELVAYLGDQFSANMTHFIAIVAFVLLWKLHRLLANTILGFEVLHNALSSVPNREPCPEELFVKQEHARSLVSSEETISSEDDAWLQNEVPESTAAERLRFLISRTGDKLATAQALRGYLAWRKEYGAEGVAKIQQSRDSDDTDLWAIATELAFQCRGETNVVTLPQFVRCYKVKTGEPLCDSIGARMFYLMPGLIDDRIYKDTTIYASALAIYFDLHLQRDSTEKVSVVIDVRGGVGWRNLHAASQLPFIQSTAKLLLTMFPERLARALVFPIPAGFVWLWNIASRCVDTKTRNKVGLLSGPATIFSPQPTDQMLSFMSRDAAQRLEDERIASFKQ